MNLLLTAWGWAARFIPPRTDHDLLIDQFVTIFIYPAITMTITSIRGMRQSLGKIIISALNGLTLPIALVLVTLPFCPRNHLPLDATTVSINLMIAGFIGGIASLWVLFTDP